MNTGRLCSLPVSLFSDRVAKEFVVDVLKATGIRKSFGGVVALDGADLICPADKIVGLLGANGSGKSTMSRIINGTYRPESGSIVYRGKAVRFQSPREATRAGISMVYQNLSLVSDLTVWENINLGIEPLSKMGFLDNSRAKSLAREYLDKLCPWIDTQQKTYRLLPAEQQLVEIVKSLSRQPNFLILDEPTAALEKNHVNMLFELMRSLKKEGVSIIFISHRIQEVKEICDYLVIFRNGKTVGTIDFEKEGKDEAKIVALITGESHQNDASGRKPKNFGPEVLTVQDIKLEPKLNGVSFSVRAGEIVGVAGLQGQGQEELMLALAGFYPSTRGQIRLAGQPVKLRHPKDAIRAGMVLVPGNRQREGLFLKHSIFMNIIYCQAAMKKTSWILRMKALKDSCRHVCRQLSLKTPSIFTPAGELSGGNQQKVVVANWLPLNPKVLLLSDPAKGVDVQAKADLYNLLTKIAAQGTAVVLYASDNEELLSFCNRILVLYEGVVVEDVINKEIDEKYLMNAAMRTVSYQ